jgi:hypothetical protein
MQTTRCSTPCKLLSLRLLSYAVCCRRVALAILPAVQFFCSLIIQYHTVASPLWNFCHWMSRISWCFHMARWAGVSILPNANLYLVDVAASPCQSFLCLKLGAVAAETAPVAQWHSAQTRDHRAAIAAGIPLSAPRSVILSRGTVHAPRPRDRVSGLSRATTRVLPHWLNVSLRRLVSVVVVARLRRRENNEVRWEVTRFNNFI